MNNIITFEDTVIAYVQSIKMTKSVNTFRAYSRSINKFVNFLNIHGFDINQPVDKITIDPFLEFLNELEGTIQNKSTMQIVLASLSSFKKWLYDNKYLRDDQLMESYYDEQVSSLLRNIQKSVKNDFNLPLEKLLLDINQLNFMDVEHNRNVALLHFLISTDCKPHEISNIRVKDIDLLSQAATIQTTPTKTRYISFSQQAANSIRIYWTNRGWENSEDPAFARHDRGVGKRHQSLTSRSVQNIVQEVCKDVGIDQNITPSDLRAVYYLTILDYQINISDAERMMSFNSFNTTRVYSKPVKHLESN